LIHHAQFVVCPYREATQSGVLSSTNTLGKTVLCTNVGAFPESVKHNHNGLLCEPNAVSIANGLLQMLQNDYYLQLEKQVETTSSQQTKMTIKNTILQAYETTCM
jgi:glycosyltransferase involved in cell wall biosynthesis